MAWQDAVQGEGVRLLLEVSAGAKRSLFPAGYNPWRQRIGIQVRAPAQDGKANMEVCRVVADFFGVPATSVAIVAGLGDPRKTVVVRGLRRDAALVLLEAAL